ncbi:hypothetical protein HJC23_011951, partial [Cyclotella cryptica]
GLTLPCLLYKTSFQPAAYRLPTLPKATNDTKIMSLPRQKPCIVLLFSLIAFTILLNYSDQTHATTFVVTAAESGTPNEEECLDTNENCDLWASVGECEVNPGYMHVNCPVSCGTCRHVRAVESEERALLIEEVAKYGERQRVEGEHAVATLQVLRETIHYMQTILPNMPPEIINKCINREDLCAFWSSIGECTNNPEFMSQYCGPSCQNCGVAVIPPCPPPGVVPAVVPGGLNDLFGRIVANAPGNNTILDVEEEMTNYTVHVHSRPGSNKRGIINTQLDMQQDPWIITLDNFLTEDECAALIEHGHKVGYIPRYDNVEVLPDGSSVSLESETPVISTAWCDYPNNCRSEDIPQRIHDRIAKVTGIMVGNSEDFQISKYETGQVIDIHHDYVDAQQNRRCGPRILTFLLYLSDVDGGGETIFPYFGITVKPKLGRALLWPNVFHSDPKTKDKRMVHGAKSVVKGQKFVANAWLHLYEFVNLPCGV